MYTITALAALVGYLLASFVFLGDIAIRGQTKGIWSFRIIQLGFALNLVAVVIGVVQGQALLSMPGGLLLAALMIVGGYLAISWRNEIHQVGALVAPLAVLLITVVILAGPEYTGTRVAPSLLTVHIALAFLGTAAFSLSFLISLHYLAQARQLKRKNFGRLFQALPSLDELDTVSFRCVSVGFPVYTAAIILGVVWILGGQVEGEQNYTSYALAVSGWFVYGVVFQSRIKAGFRGTKAAVFTIVGFLAAAGVLVAYVLK